MASVRKKASVKKSLRTGIYDLPKSMERWGIESERVHRRFPLNEQKTGRSWLPKYQALFHLLWQDCEGLSGHFLVKVNLDMYASLIFSAYVVILTIHASSNRTDLLFPRTNGPESQPTTKLDLIYGCKRIDF